ncbi:MAG: hypothetical protein JWM27_65 [Gemmatimonadetes bacterium]|nr:hypothetical protein [Gemmatimonadota bacterium]
MRRPALSGSAHRRSCEQSQKQGRGIRSGLPVPQIDSGPRPAEGGHGVTPRQSYAIAIRFGCDCYAIAMRLPMLLRCVRHPIRIANAMRLPSRKPLPSPFEGVPEPLRYPSERVREGYRRPVLAFPPFHVETRLRGDRLSPLRSRPVTPCHEEGRRRSLAPPFAPSSALLDLPSTWPPTHGTSYRSPSASPVSVATCRAATRNRSAARSDRFARASSTSASCSRLPGRGLRSPDSHPRIASRVIPASFATRVCDRPDSSNASRTSTGIPSVFGFRTHPLCSYSRDLYP